MQEKDGKMFGDAKKQPRNSQKRQENKKKKKLFRIISFRKSLQVARKDFDTTKIQPHSFKN